ncbi:MAG: MBL fold metallo-hydrolase, partial [Thermoleophilia bacterium]|nr:MBL fold metallo-hydrolase [Thermoleophilia bacterium]
VLTHAHIDHSGRLPRLVKKGFSGLIYATPPTVDLAEIMLLDSAYIQETEAEWRGRKAKRAGRKGPDPLYDEGDARKTISQLKQLDYGAATELAPGVTALFRDAGHILGSATLELRLEENGNKTTVVFSGDLGQPDRPIVRTPEIIEHADYLVIESTYGDRLHPTDGEPVKQLTAIIEEAGRTGGNVIIPAFAVGRTQQIVYYLRVIMDEQGFDMPVYVDSPLASRATDVYRKHREAFDEEAWQLVGEPGGIFDFPNLHYTESADESRALNEKKGIVIISASGMADAGRIRHHLKHNLWRPEAHVVVVGYQAEGSLGRRLLDGVPEVRIFGDEIAVKAHVHEVTGLSAHADQGQLLDWASHFTPPRLTLVTHGETNAALTLAGLLEERLGFQVDVPEMNEVFKLG